MAVSTMGVTKGNSSGFKETIDSQASTHTVRVKLEGLLARGGMRIQGLTSVGT
jgi:hypothetical protein